MAKYKSDINLFDCIFSDKSKKAVNFEKELKKYSILFVIVAAATVAVGFAAVQSQKALTSAANENIAMLQSQHDFQKIAEKKAEAEKLEADNQKIRSELSNFESSIQFKTELFGYISAAQPEDIVINSFSFSGDTINLSCRGSDELTIARFASRLRDEKDVFGEVQYTGASKGGVNLWNGNISVKIVERAVKEDEAEQEE